jgi:uncharacterized membrane protein
VKPYLYPIIVAAVCGFILYGNASVIMSGMGWHRDILSHSAIGVGLLVIVLGAIMGNVPQNGVIGIRTPWTLASEEVWARTHRIGRWLFVLAGVAAAVAGLMGLRMLPGLVAIGAAAIVSVGYSYFAWRRLGGGSD